MFCCNVTQKCSFFKGTTLLIVSDESHGVGLCLGNMKYPLYASSAFHCLLFHDPRFLLMPTTHIFHIPPRPHTPPPLPTASALPIVHDALMRVVPWVGWRTAQHGQRGMLHCLLRAVCSRQETQASAAVWVLWLLCAKVLLP